MIVGPVAWEWVAFVAALAVVGVVAVGWQVAEAGRWVRARWADARAVIEDEDEPPPPRCQSCIDDDGPIPHRDCEAYYDGCCCEGDARFEDLPPERSQEELGFTGPAPESAEVRHWHDLEARRERLAGAAELEHRAAYEALGFEFPSGLMARVREQAP